jgi:general nucleoside transport system ATP-binding protein
MATAVTTAPAARLELRGIRKSYAGFVANDGIDLTATPGEIHALLGENGAGKSTLMKIVYGVVKPDAGEIRWEGHPVSIANPAEARRLGIGMVFQHFSLFETLTAAENIALGLPGKADIAALSRRIVDVSRRYGLPIEPARSVHSMSVGERQRVEIVRALLQTPKLLIMDEPTSVLTPQAVQTLFETLRQLALEGCSILYISHKLDEIRSLCTAATILRGGRVTGSCDPRRETASNLARMMIGKDLPACRHSQSQSGHEARLVIKDLSLRSDDPFGTDLKGITLSVRAGEILGIAGISGNGQRELMAALSGETLVADRSAISVGSVGVGTLHPRERRKLGMCFVPEERLGRGAVPTLSLADNGLLTANEKPMVRTGLVWPRPVRAFAQNCIATYDVRCGGTGAVAKSLSGGNLQKFIVGREILQRPKVLLISQPTWGVDIGAAAFIRQSLIDLRNAGAAILVVSEEIDELFEISDSIAVLASGQITLLKPTSETNVTEIGLAMTGRQAESTTTIAAAEMAGQHAH